MSSASVGRSDDGVVSEVDGAISGDCNAGHPESAVGFDLESAWSFQVRASRDLGHLFGEFEAGRRSTSFSIVLAEWTRAAMGDGGG